MKTKCIITITNVENAVLKSFELVYNHSPKAALNYALNSVQKRLKTPAPRLFLDDAVARLRYRQRIAQPNTYNQDIYLTIDLKPITD